MAKGIEATNVSMRGWALDMSVNEERMNVISELKTISYHSNKRLGGDQAF